MSETSDPILSCLESILSELKLLNDLIRSNQSNQIKSDQIRSDQISKNRSNIGDNWMESLRSELEVYGISYDTIDLRSIEQGALYYLSNKSKIISRKKYLLQVIAKAEPSTSALEKRERKQSSAPIRQSSQSDDSMILGFDKDEVESKAIYLDENTFDNLFKKMDKSYKTMFSSFENVSKSVMKRNLATALAMKEGLL